MLDLKIKKKFDSARQILVGKIPSPSAQIEQITFAMINFKSSEARYLAL